MSLPNLKIPIPIHKSEYHTDPFINGNLGHKAMSKNHLSREVKRVGTSVKLGCTKYKVDRRPLDDDNIA